MMMYTSSFIKRFNSRVKKTHGPAKLFENEPEKFSEMLHERIDDELASTNAHGSTLSTESSINYDTDKLIDKSGEKGGEMYSRKQKTTVKKKTVATFLMFENDIFCTMNSRTQVLIVTDMQNKLLFSAV